ncbi:MAG: low molecular weight protein-tyrosine-phosphatase [Verrucomicrobiota bacterium]
MWTERYDGMARAATCCISRGRDYGKGMAEKPYRILFVCMGNICRSPAGECVMRMMTESEGMGDEIECDSAGTIGYHAGNAPDARMRKAATARGIRIDGAARQVRESDFSDFDLILTMDEENFADVDQMRGRKGGRADVRRFCEFLTEHDDSDVPDPYYGGDAGFEYVLDLLEDGCAELIRKFKETGGRVA